MRLAHRKGLVMKPPRAPRLANAVLGIWLSVSTFIWPHAAAQRSDALVIGILAVAFALSAIQYPTVRYMNSVLAIWLLFSAWAGEVATDMTRWNNTLVASAMFALSLVPMAPS